MSTATRWLTRPTATPSTTRRRTRPRSTAATSVVGDDAPPPPLNPTTAGFTGYTNLTVQTGDGQRRRRYFCKAIGADRHFDLLGERCHRHRGRSGGWMSRTHAMHRFDVYTVAGWQGERVPDVADDPERRAGRPGGASPRVTATANNGIITYVQSAAPTGTFDLTYGICANGHGRPTRPAIRPATPVSSTTARAPLEHRWRRHGDR